MIHEQSGLKEDVVTKIEKGMWFRHREQTKVKWRKIYIELMWMTNLDEYGYEIHSQIKSRKFLKRLESVVRGIKKGLYVSGTREICQDYAK